MRYPSNYEKYWRRSIGYRQASTMMFCDATKLKRFMYLAWEAGRKQGAGEEWDKHFGDGKSYKVVDGV